MITEAPTNSKSFQCLRVSKGLHFYLFIYLTEADGGYGRRRRERADLVAEASLKDIELFVDRHLVKLAFGNLLFEKDNFAPEGKACS
jgi:hypothetical protein